MAMDEVSRIAEYNVFWDTDMQLEFDGWVSREEAEARKQELLVEERKNGYYDEEELAEIVVLVRRWRVTYIDDDWDHLHDEVAEVKADDERELADEVRLTLND